MQFHIFTAVLTVVIYLILRYRNQDNEWYAITVPILLYGYKFVFTNSTLTNTLTNTATNTDASTIGLMTAPYPSSSN